MQQLRATESADEIALRLVKDSTRKAQKRALETSDETSSRQEQDRACKAKRKETETVIETAQRRQQNRACKAKMNKPIITHKSNLLSYFHNNIHNPIIPYFLAIKRMRLYLHRKKTCA